MELVLIASETNGEEDLYRGNWLFKYYVVEGAYSISIIEMKRENPIYQESSQKVYNFNFQKMFHAFMVQTAPPICACVYIYI